MSWTFLRMYADDTNHVVVPTLLFPDKHRELVDKSNPQKLPLDDKGNPPWPAPEGFWYTDQIMVPEYEAELEKEYPGITKEEPPPQHSKLDLDQEALAIDVPPGSKIGVDFDNTLNKNPEGFKKLFEKVLAEGGEVHIITARPGKDEAGNTSPDAQQLLTYLSQNHIVIPEERIHFYDKPYTKETYHKHADNLLPVFKMHVLQEFGITIFIDDNPAYLNMAKEHLKDEVSCYQATTATPHKPYDDSFMKDTDKGDGTKKPGSLTKQAIDQGIFIEQPVDIGSLIIAFHDQFFDYYLRAPGQPDNHYVTDIGEQKVGFASKYQLRKFIDTMRKERFTEGIIPALNIKVRPIPTLSEPVVRRLGAIQVVEPEPTDPSAPPKPLQPDQIPSVYGEEEVSADQQSKLRGPTGPMV